MTRATLIISYGLLLSGCVTVKFGGAETQRANGVHVNEPARPFERQSRDDVDAAFKNPRNGNVISYLSDCKDPSDPPLDNIVAGVLAGLTDLKTEQREETSMLGREARRVQASGKVDGVPSAIDLIVFKRNQCIYILSYVGVKSSFAENRSDFVKFIEGFKVP